MLLRSQISSTLQKCREFVPLFYCRRKSYDSILYLIDGRRQAFQPEVDPEEAETGEIDNGMVETVELNMEIMSQKWGSEVVPG